MQTIEQRLTKLEEQAANYRQCFLDLYAANDATAESLNVFRNEIRTAVDTATITFRDLDSKSDVINKAVARAQVKLNESLQVMDALRQRLQIAADTLRNQVVVTRPASRLELKDGLAVPVRGATREELK
jgi:hypothetical protein